MTWSHNPGHESAMLVRIGLCFYFFLFFLISSFNIRLSWNSASLFFSLLAICFSMGPRYYLFLLDSIYLLLLLFFSHIIKLNHHIRNGKVYNSSRKFCFALKLANNTYTFFFKKKLKRINKTCIKVWATYLTQANVSATPLLHETPKELSSS